ncbi:hypothetical protein [Corynebacterium sp. A21]|uniref:hypothetical protein n=1 Tax=Corynebacterium sp. A21 TaxID=3457318 RepID=UPI003FCFAC2E
MNSAALNFDTHLTAALTQLNHPFRIPPTTSLPGTSRTATALEEATQRWRRHCTLASQAVGDHLTQLREFSLALESTDREFSESFKAYR